MCLSQDTFAAIMESASIQTLWVMMLHIVKVIEARSILRIFHTKYYLQVGRMKELVSL